MPLPVLSSTFTVALIPAGFVTAVLVNALALMLLAAGAWSGGPAVAAIPGRAAW